MSQSVQLSVLRTNVLRRANMENSQFVDSSLGAEVDALISAAANECYEEILSSYGEEYYVSSTTITTSPGVDAYSLPGDFLKLVGVDMTYGGTTVSLEPFMFRERNRYKYDLYVLADRPLMYRLRGSNLAVIPQPSGAYNMTVWYIPTMTPLSTNSTTFDGVAGWEEFIIWAATASLLAKEESDPSYALQMKESSRTRIRQQAPNRNAGSPERVTDVSRDMVPWWVAQ